MNMVQSLHYFKPGQDVTAVATEDVTGARFVSLKAGGSDQVPNVAHSDAGDRSFGVSARDAKEDEEFLVHTGGVVPITAGASITAPAEITAGEDGKAVSAGDGETVLGLLIADVASGKLASVHLL